MVRFSSLVILLSGVLIGCGSQNDSTTPVVQKDQAPAIVVGNQNATIDYKKYPDKHFIVQQPGPVANVPMPAGVCSVTSTEKRTVTENGQKIEETIYYYGEKIDPELLNLVPVTDMQNIGFYEQTITDKTDFSQDIQPRRTVVSLANYTDQVIPQVDFIYSFINKDGKSYRFIARRSLFNNRDWGLFGSLLPLSVVDGMPGPVLLWPNKEWYTSTEAGWDRVRIYHWRKPQPVTNVQSLIPEMISQEKIEDVPTLMKNHPDYWNLKATYGGGTTPQMIAFVLGNKTLNELAFKHGATMDMKNDYGMGIMHFAARSWDSGTIDRLIALGGDVRAVDLDRNTPLHMASTMLIMENLEALLKHKADPNAVSQYGHTPTTLAVKVGQPLLFSRLIKAGGRIDNVYNAAGDPVIVAMGRNMDVVKELLNSGYPIEQKSVRTGGTLLVEASRYGQFEFVGELLDRGANRQAKDNFGADFLESAKESNTLGTNRFLLEYLEKRKKPKK
jgi:ankyrin repeat protein